MLISAAAIRDSHTACPNTVSVCFSGEPLDVPLCLFPPSASLILPSRLPLLLCLTLFFLVSFLALSFADSAPISLHPFVLESLLPPCHFCLCLSLLLSLSLSLFPQSVRADISGTLRQVACRGFTRLHEMRDEKRSVRVTIHFTLLDASCDVLKDVMKGQIMQVVYSV